MSDNELINEINQENGDLESDIHLETDVHEEIPQPDENNENYSEDESKKKVVKPKRIIKNPQPKLNEQTLKTPKGLSAIKAHFKDLKLKGKGYEEHDLNVIMKTYEYWCHRLFPKYTFDDCIERLEKLGTKRATQTYLKRIRLGLDDFEEENKLESDDEIATSGFVEPFVDPFDQLVTTNNVVPEPELTEDQLETIRQNMLKAQALRHERLSKIVQSSQALDHNNREIQSQNYADQTTAEIEVEEELMDIDNMLDMINEKPSSSQDILNDIS